MRKKISVKALGENIHVSGEGVECQVSFDLVKNNPIESIKVILSNCGFDVYEGISPGKENV